MKPRSCRQRLAAVNQMKPHFVNTVRAPISPNAERSTSVRSLQAAAKCDPQDSGARRLVKGAGRAGTDSNAHIAADAGAAGAMLRAGLRLPARTPIAVRFGFG